MESKFTFLGDKSEKDCLEFARPADDMIDSSRDRPRVLVVDDQKLIADTLTEILIGASFEAVAAYSGAQALDIATRFRPDWVISDVLMPQMHGVALAIMMRQKYPRVSILLFSGQSGISEILQEGQREGYEFELIGKPVHPLTLIKRLKQE